MRIAYVVGQFPVISETFVVNQIAGMVTRGCHVDILAMSDGPVADSSQTAISVPALMSRVKRFRGSRNYPLRLWQVLWLLLTRGWRAPGPVFRSLNARRFGRSAATLDLLHAVLMAIRLDTRQYDVIHAQFGPYGNVAWRLRETGVIGGRLVTSFRGYDATKYLRENPQAYDHLFRKGDLFLPVSEALATRIIEAGCDRSRVHVHRSGIECARLTYQERKRKGAEPARAIMIGRLVEKKGISYGVRAIARVIASGRAVSCTIIGDGPLRNELEQLIHGLDLGAHVRMSGARSHDEALRLLAQSHILIAPSVTATDGDEEGIPNSVKEGMAMGLPVIATRHAGIPELVDDGVSGFLVPERDIGALVDGLVRLIDHPETWGAMGRAGRRKVESEFDMNKLNDELLALYNGLCETHRSPLPHRNGDGSSKLSSAKSIGCRAPRRDTGYH